MLPGQRAAVRPRVLLPESTTALPLEDEVRALLERRRGGLVQVLGGPGSGKTTALRHLAAVLSPLDPVVLLDGAPAAGFEAPEHTLTVYASVERLEGRAALAVYRLAPWQQDEWIEYLLARHPSRCASVVRRLREASSDAARLPRVPELWSVVLDRLAEDESIGSVREALASVLQQELSNPDVKRVARLACLHCVQGGGPVAPLDVAELWGYGCGDRLLNLLRHEAVQILLAAEKVAADLLAKASTLYLGVRLPRELVRETAKAMQGAEAVLKPLLRELPCGRQAMVASILHAMGTGWRPEGARLPGLVGAYLDGAFWANVDLTRAQLISADLRGADLRGARLDRAAAPDADFTGATLHRTSLSGLHGGRARFVRADLFEATGEAAVLPFADFERASLDRARLPGARLDQANLTEARLCGADLTGAVLTGATVEATDFTDADLSRANLVGLKLARAVLTGARFAGADLSCSDLEDVTLPGADFTKANLRGALLTGSAMRGATFAGACLAEAGLAEIEWEDVDLRGADLRKATFHLGSSRSGMLNTPIASEGSRTGFYTDDYEEQAFKSPEEIRKANLCGADLRGADLGDVDFYLVDLRGAKYDREQARHFRRCGAILQSRV